MAGTGITFSVFPTGVGMNRKMVKGEGREISVPHRRGDEPRIYL